MDKPAENIGVDIEFLKKLRDKTILLYLSSCDYNEEFLEFPYDYIVLNSSSFRKKEQGQYIRLIRGKILLMPFDNEYCIRLLINAGLKINCFVGIQDGCVEGANHECINSQTFFSRLSPLLPKEFLYITNHFFNYRKPEANRLPFTFHSLKLKQLPFNPACLSTYDINQSKWKFLKVKRTASESVFFLAGKIHVHVHHASIWDCKVKVDGLVIPNYPPDVLRNYLPDFNNQKYLMQRNAKEEMLTWANQNRHETIAAVAFDTDEIMTRILLPQLKAWNETYPKRIDFYHLKINELRLFRTRPTYDPTEILLKIKRQDVRFSTLKEYLKSGRGDPYIVSYLILQYGSKSLKPLITGLSCPVAEMRYHCVVCLGQLGNISSVDALIQMFREPENEPYFPTISATVAEVCRWISMDRVYRALKFTTSDIRANIKRLISEIGHVTPYPEYEVHLKGSYNSVFKKTVENPNESQEIIWEPVTSIIEQLDEPDPKKKIAAAEKLGKRANRKATDNLCLMLYDYDPEVQFAAIEALRIIGDKRATNAFNFFLPQKTCYHRREMAEAMGELHDRRAVPVLAKVYFSAWLELRVEIVKSLGKLGGKTAIEALISAMKDKHPKIRQIVLRQLKNIRNDKAFKTLKQAFLIERDKQVKKQIELALLHFWDTE